MQGLGYRKVRSGVFSNAHISDKTWFSQESGLMVSDVKPDNLFVEEGGDIVIIDLIVQHFPKDHPLHRLFSENLIE